MTKPYIVCKYLESLASDPAWLRFGHHKNIQLIWLRNGWFITYLFIYIFTSKSAIQIMYIIRLDGVYIKNVHTKVKNWKRTILTWTFQNLYPCQISVALHSPWKVAPSLLQDQKVENCSEGEHLFQGGKPSKKKTTKLHKLSKLHLPPHPLGYFAHEKFAPDL